MFVILVKRDTIVSLKLFGYFVEYSTKLAASYQKFGTKYFAGR